MAQTKQVTKRRTTRRARKQDSTIPMRVAVGTAATTVVMSMWLNVEAFNASGFTVKGTVVGLLLPIWVLALTYIGHHMHAQRWTSGSAYALAAFALLVSLPHLAHGYEAMGLQPYEGWSLAVVTDLLQVVMKVAVIQMVLKK